MSNKAGKRGTKKRGRVPHASKKVWISGDHEDPVTRGKGTEPKYSALGLVGKRGKNRGQDGRFSKGAEGNLTQLGC